MLASEMKELATKSRNKNNDFNKQWEEMKNKIREYANEGKNYCPMVYGACNEQLISNLQENGFEVMRKMELFPHIQYGAINCMQLWVVW